MALFKADDLRRRAALQRITKSVTSAYILNESQTSRLSEYDVFLSHSKMDEELIHGVKTVLEDYGLTVYVDWIDNPELNRDSVTARTASTLRDKMRVSRMLVYAHTLNSTNSRWCPWELGYFDGHRGGNVFIFPIALSDQHSFYGQEYLGLYPYLDKVGAELFVNGSQEPIAYLREAKAKVLIRL